MPLYQNDKTTHALEILKQAITACWKYTSDGVRGREREAEQSRKRRGRVEQKKKISNGKYYNQNNRKTYKKKIKKIKIKKQPPLVS